MPISKPIFILRGSLLIFAVVLSVAVGKLVSEPSGELYLQHDCSMGACIMLIRATKFRSTSGMER